MRVFCMCYIVCSRGETTAITAVYLHTLKDLIPTELLERGLKWMEHDGKKCDFGQAACAAGTSNSQRLLNGFRKRAGSFMYRT